MVVSDTVHLVGEVHCEGDTIQALVADDAPEAAGVIGLPHGLEDLARRMGGGISLRSVSLSSYPLSSFPTPSCPPGKMLHNLRGPRSLTMEAQENKTKPEGGPRNFHDCGFLLLLISWRQGHMKLRLAFKTL